MNIADIIGIIILILFAAWGMRKGFVKSIYSLGSLILSLILALTLYPPVSSFLKDSVVYDYVQLNVYKVFSEEKTEEIKVEETDSVLKLPEKLKESIVTTAEETTAAITESVAKSVADIAINLLSILVVFLLVKLLLWIILKLFDILSKLPLIRTANKLLGGLTGLLYGFLLIYILLALLTFTTTLNTFNEPVEIILSSKYISKMYHQNVLLSFLP